MSGETGRPWRVEISSRAEKQIVRLPARERDRILSAILALRAGLEAGDVKRLHGRPEWRLRVGRWRVILDVYAQARLIVAVEAGPRGDIYK